MQERPQESSGLYRVGYPCRKLKLPSATPSTKTLPIRCMTGRRSFCRALLCFIIIEQKGGKVPDWVSHIEVIGPSLAECIIGRRPARDLPVIPRSGDPALHGWNRFTVKCATERSTMPRMWRSCPLKVDIQKRAAALCVARDFVSIEHLSKSPL